MRVLVVLALSLCAAAHQCANGGVYNDMSGMCYEFVTTLRDFPSAQLDCASRGGALASIPNAFDNSFIAGVAQVKVSAVDFWIGGFSLRGSPEWLWSDWTQMKYTHWSPNEPTATGNGCASMLTSNGKWESIYCSLEKPYLCATVASNATTIAPPTTAPPPTTASGSCRLRGWKYFDGHCYKFFDMSGPQWAQAEQACVNTGAHLVSIHSDEEAQFIHDLLKSADNYYSWLGLHSVGGEWKWSDGTPVDYGWNTTQTPTQPNNLCTQFYVADADGWNWFDVYCEYNNFYICKQIV